MFSNAKVSNAFERIVDGSFVLVVGGKLMASFTTCHVNGVLMLALGWRSANGFSEQLVFDKVVWKLQGCLACLYSCLVRNCIEIIDVPALHCSSISSLVAMDVTNACVFKRSNTKEVKSKVKEILFIHLLIYSFFLIS